MNISNDLGIYLWQRRHVVAYRLLNQISEFNLELFVRSSQHKRNKKILVER